MINTVLNSPLEWSDVLESVYDSKIDSIGLNERVASLATRSIKKDSKLHVDNGFVTKDGSCIREDITKIL
jgi:hypothetical protein